MHADSGLDDLARDVDRVESLRAVLNLQRTYAQYAQAGSWNDVAALFTAGSLAVSAYIAHKASDSTFGAATSIVLIVLWVHYAAHAFFYGAALTAARARHEGSFPRTP